MEIEEIPKPNIPSPFPIMHIRQRYRWDCGVSCVLMVLPPKRRCELMTRFHEVCREEGFGSSTWTIDLCYLLRRYGVKHHMYTTVFGVNEAHSNNRYYDKILDLDSSRVRRRFASASALGIKVSLAQWEPSLLYHHLNKGHSAIVLIDGTMLACDVCKHNKLVVQFRSWFGGTYAGHYVVVVSMSQSQVRFLDPAVSHSVCVASVGRFITACRQRGTDNDIILVYNGRDKKQ